MHHRDQVRLSKRMSLALRHAPGRFGLTLDRAGWVTVDDLLAALRMTRAELDEVVAGSDKQRFAIEHGPGGSARIRADQGHSVPVELGLAPRQPPPELFHGTGAGALASIRATGLRRAARRHVHLSADVEAARRVGAAGAARSWSSPSTPARWPRTATRSTAAPTVSG